MRCFATLSMTKDLGYGARCLSERSEESHQLEYVNGMRCFATLSMTKDLGYGFTFYTL